MDRTCFKLLLVMAHTFVVYGQYCVNTTAYSMTNTNAMTIDLSTFANCTSATYVNVSNNQIAKLENETFYYILSIRILDLSFNNLTEIGSDTLSNLRQLKYLYITNNNLRTLPMDFFVNKLSLITVDLSYNRIYEIPLPVFGQELPAIKKVILHHNELTAYEPWALAYEKEYQVIQYIDLRYNNIYKFTNDYNWSYPGRHVLDWSLTDVRFNNLTHMEIDYYQQYKSKSGHDAVSTIMAEVLVDVRNNSIICDCFLYWIAQSAHESFFKWTNNDLLKIYCQEPPELQNKLAFYEVRPSEFICNVTLNCPAGCLCQERPEARVIHVDCNNRSLANIPDILPSNTDYSAYDLIVNNNQITRIENVSYSQQLSVFDASNNLISYISKEFIEKIAEKHEVRINLRNNHLTSVTDAMENIKYQNVDLSGNNLVCDCSMLWMKNWINLAPKYTDKNLNCTFENEIYRVIDLNEDILNCSNIGNIILIVFLSVGLVIVIALIVTAKRCPYATKVLIFKIFRIHPADRYIVDTVPDENYEYDA